MIIVITIYEHLVSPPFFLSEVRTAVLCFAFMCVFLRLVSCAQYWLLLWIVNSLFPFRFTL